MIKAIASAMLILALSGCGGEEDKRAAGAGKAEGEILPGSASDAMIPLDQVKSQAPLAPKSEGGDKKDAKEPAKAKESAAAEPAEPAAEEPAAEE
ncbi:MAG TPA: hypothetical protein PK680_05705 [Novosphingobium sp.]|nr:hypothetical protein [Novosphingobium sp.]HQA17862.1 hypothetical protein [Novosphingobium sp.]